MWDVALSTMWGIGQFERLADFFTAAQALGFNRFELNHQVNSAMLNGVNLKNHRIVSLHELCPADISTATLQARNWLISSPDEDGRQQGIRAIQRSIVMAQELDASLVVVHPGRVDVDQQLENELWGLFEAGQVGTPQYDEVKEHLTAARQAQADANLDAVRRSLLELADYAGQAGVRLGLENRYHYLDIPLLDELGLLLESTGDERIGFLYDAGHAQTLEFLGFDPHEEWLRRYAARMFGAHLHDVKGLKDHQAAGLGEIDWDMVSAYLPKDAIRTFEFRGYNTPQQISAALEFLAEKGCIRRL